MRIYKEIGELSDLAGRTVSPFDYSVDIVCRDVKIRIRHSGFRIFEILHCDGIFFAIPSRRESFVCYLKERFFHFALPRIYYDTKRPFYTHYGNSENI